ncbi:MAG: acyltransferase family protein [Polyangiaceae bacterium]
MKRARILELDGLRGAAASIVVIAHFFGETPHGTTALAAAWIGVDVFFVLSGFLIGTIILDNVDTPRFFRVFYSKRAVRIFPIYGVTCFVTLILVALTRGHPWSDKPLSPLVYVFFLQNIVLSFWGGGGVWLLPTWTLAVEERFYLILPLLIYFTRPARRAPVLIALWLAAPLFRWATFDANPMAAWTLLPSRMDLLIAGVIAALFQKHFDPAKHLQLSRLVPVICAFLLAIFGGAEHFYPRFEKTFTLINPTLLSVGIGSFLLSIINGAPEGARWRSSVLRYLGKISYALYLVHQPISGLLHGLILNEAPDVGTPAQIAVTLLAIACSVGVAALSWEILEKPCLAWYRGDYERSP